VIRPLFSCRFSHLFHCPPQSLRASCSGMSVVYITSERVIPAIPGQVWSALTHFDLLRRWLVDVELLPSSSPTLLADTPIQLRIAGKHAVTLRPTTVREHLLLSFESQLGSGHQGFDCITLSAQTGKAQTLVSIRSEHSFGAGARTPRKPEAWRTWFGEQQRLPFQLLSTPSETPASRAYDRALEALAKLFESHDPYR
jgi:uncharacterized protein YndB with AHSA1/START domain